MGSVPGTVQVGGALKVHCRFKLHSRTYLSTETFEALSLRLPTNAWVWLSLRRVAGMSKKQARSSADTQAIKRLLASLATDQDWRLAAACRPRDITVQVALEAFKHIEDKLSATNLSDDSRTCLRMQPRGAPGNLRIRTMQASWRATLAGNPGTPVSAD